MIEKVNPKHPDKIADRIAGAIVDLAYTRSKRPKIAVEILIGHGECNVIIETSVEIEDYEVEEIAKRIAEEPELNVRVIEVPQDEKLAENQDGKIRCGDNGIFKGMPVTKEQQDLSRLAHELYETYESDGKYLLDKNKKLVVCQSNAKNSELMKRLLKEDPDIEEIIVNPLGEWTGGINVDTGATNRKLGSDMADAVTGGGLHGKDLSKADVSINIYAFLKAQQTQKPFECCCAIGDEIVDGKPYEEIVQIAKDYIEKIGGFEKLAEWRTFLKEGIWQRWQNYQSQNKSKIN